MALEDDWPVASLPFPDERELPRQPVRLDATVRELRSVARRCRIVDLTERGCRIAGAGLSRGDEIWVHIDGYDAARATTIWAKGDEAGCLFYAAPYRVDGRPRQALFGARAA